MVAINHSTKINQQQITINESGDYLLAYNDSLTSALQRSNPIIRVQVNGIDVSGAETKTHYNRTTSGHNESSGTINFLLRNLAAGDIVSLSSEQEDLAGTVNDNDDAILFLQKK